MADLDMDSTTTPFRQMITSTPLPPTWDFHVHLRDGAMSHLVVPTIRKGGVNTVYVMPNLSPPLITVEAVLSYKTRLQAIDPSIKYLMTLYLHPSLTPQIIRDAKIHGIVGVKWYPAGVTTGSEMGVKGGRRGYEMFHEIFKEMEEVGLVLNLHGECPSSHHHHHHHHSSAGGKEDEDDPPQSKPRRKDAGDDDIPKEDEEEEKITILNAESSFLPTLLEVHSRYPRLRIVLEHCTTASAVQTILEECGPNVCGTITPHHLFLTVDDWAGDVWNYCKPVAKTPRDRNALLNAIVNGRGRFFLGSDSAPHDVLMKLGGINSMDDARGGMNGKKKAAAGIFTQPFVTQLVLSALEEGIQRGVISEKDVTRDVLEGFLRGWGRGFYFPDGIKGGGGGIDEGDERIVLIPPPSSNISPPTSTGEAEGDGRDDGHIIPETITNQDSTITIIPFKAGERTWSLRWI
ncbi:MAG: hypothetical protein M1823_004369 [Watsoniomyces obsoletus]|nr:MAG: hypothetical protein M1823_004369 [Watsoniomyces obsoletus]